MNYLTRMFALVCLMITACSDGGTEPDNPQDPPQPVVTDNGFDTPNASDYHSRFSPDGNQIAYTVYDGTINEIWLYDISTETARPLIQGRTGDLYLAWSADGTKLVFDSHDSSRRNQIFIYDLSTENITQVTSSNSHVFQADWCRVTNKLILEYEGYLSEMNSDGTERVRILNSSITTLFCAVSFDGTRIAFDSSKEGNRDIYVIDRDGTNEVKITDFSGPDTRPRWSPDGTKLLYDSDRSGNRDIWVYNFSDQTHTQITSTSGWDAMGDWSPDETQIVYSEEHDPSSRYGSRISIINY